MTPRDFVEKYFNKDQVDKAVRQQKQIQYLAVSGVQEDTYFDKNIVRSEIPFDQNDPMLSWVYSLFEKDNFMSFYRYLRFPVASSEICREEIEKSLERVFFSDDSFRNYIVRNESIGEPEFLREDDFEKEAFNALLYRYNDIYIHDLKDTNLPCRYIIDIESVVSIKESNNYIDKIAFSSFMEIEGKKVEGYIYLDDKMFAFVPLKEKDGETIEIPHDIGMCPATFISSVPLVANEPIVRRGVLSYARRLLEQYTFLSTLQTMSDANGTFPIITKLATEDLTANNNDQNGSNDPMSSSYMEGHATKKPDGTLQGGSVHEVEAPIKHDGSVDIDAVRNYINFFRTPVDSLEFIEDRINKVRKNIIEMVVGDFVEQQESAKNELQVSKSYLIKQDKLRAFGHCLNYCLTISNTIMLRLAYGPDSSSNGSYGTDFFVETQDDLFKQFKNAPNPIEKNNIIKRISRVRGINNPSRAKRDSIVYQIVPFIDNLDFQSAISLNLVSTEDQLLQTKFMYFMAIFESTYGDVVEFWESLEGFDEQRRLILIKNLMYSVVENYLKESAQVTNNLLT